MSQSAENPRESLEQQFCVDMEIFPKNRNEENAEIFLNINFYVESCIIPLGQVNVGITRGRLSLEMVNALMPLALRGLQNQLPLQIAIKRTESDDSKHSESVENKIGGTITLSNQPSSGSNLEIKRARTLERLGHRTEEYSYIDTIISAGGSIFAPFWDFEAKGPAVLKGERFDELLGRVMIKGNPCHITAFFTTSKRSLHISGSEGVWPTNMTTNNRLVRQLVIWRWLKSRLQPHLKRAYLEL